MAYTTPLKDYCSFGNSTATCSEMMHAIQVQYIPQVNRTASIQRRIETVLESSHHFVVMESVSREERWGTLFNCTKCLHALSLRVCRHLF
jgi:hypothetical protein